ncbi:MAG: hypothetical protein F6J86_01785 [Symploca sp. SIO1B1]|nr:hypothetical protein [Symploca sp. SIO1B1]
MLKKLSTMALPVALLSLLTPTLILSKSVNAQQAKIAQCDPEPTNMTIHYGDRFTCDIEVDGDSDIFRIEGTAGDRIILSVSADIMKSSEVIDPNGETIANLTTSGTIFKLNLEKTGVYTLVVSSNNGRNGPYMVEVSCLTGSCFSRSN